MRHTGDKLARYFNKKYGDILYSGTLAIETALLASGVKENDYVIIPNNVCYRVLLSVIRCGANPIIVNPKNGFVITKNDIKHLIKKYKVKAIILIHNLGIPVNIKEIKQVIGDKICIIEDASQAWMLKYAGYPIGTHSNFVVTSFGKTKPLGYGIGGGIFSNSESYRKILDYNNNISRINPNILLPYVLPEIGQINVKKLVTIGDTNNKNIYKNVSNFSHALNYPQIKFYTLNHGDIASWHRFPIAIKSEKIYKKILKSAVENNIKFDKPFKLEMSDIPLASQKNCKLEGNKIELRYMIYLYTNNNINNIKKWSRDLKKIIK